MKRIYFALFFLLFLIFIEGQTVNKIIIKLKVSSHGELSHANKVSKINKLFSSSKTEKIVLSEKDNTTIYTVEFPENADIKKIIDEYYKTGEIEYAEPNYIYTTQVQSTFTRPNDPYYNYQWGLHNDGTISAAIKNYPSKIGADINMEKAWEIQKGSDSIIVAIIDTGLNVNHPELKSRFWTHIGKNFIENQNPKDLSSTNDHATNVAGIIGASANNGIGFTGIDWNCKLMILKALDNDGSGYTTSIANAIHYAVDNGARVINLSLGSRNYSQSMSLAIEKALKNNVVVVAAMGNENSMTANYPAAYTGVIAVGAINAESNRSNPFYRTWNTGSNYGNHISVVAPGDVICSIYDNASFNQNNCLSGTSQAAPHVTGLASLLLAQDPHRTPADIKAIIEKTADDQMGNPLEDTPGWDKYYGFGRINAYRALSEKYIGKNIDLNERTIKIYPNPARQNFICDFPLNTKQITIFSNVGQIIQSKNINGLISDSFHISEPGIYFIHFRLENGKKISKKISIIK
jgi:thermitase